MKLTAGFRALALIAAFGAAGAAHADSVTVKHAEGETVIDGAPKTVVATDWGAFDNLSALGVPVAGVPGGTVPAYLADKVAPDAAKVGSLKDLDVEAIAALKPDLVVTGGRSRPFYKQIAQIAPAIDTSWENADILDETRKWLTTYGAIFDKKEQAATLVSQLDAKVAEAKAAVAGKGSALVIVTNGGKIGVYGPKSRVAWVYKTLDIPSVFDKVDDSNHGGDAITYEYLLKENPDWLFVVDRDAGIGKPGSAKALLDNELLHQANFWKNDRIVYLDPAAAYISINGYNGVMLMLDQTIAAFKAH